MAGEITTIQQLARRVSWLDRHRRKLAVLSSGAIGLLLVSRMFDVMKEDWPGHTAVPSTIIGVVVGTGLWCAIEVGLVWLTALWETEYAQLMRDRGLPRAILRKR